MNDDYVEMREENERRCEQELETARTTYLLRKQGLSEQFEDKQETIWKRFHNRQQQIAEAEEDGEL